MTNAHNPRGLFREFEQTGAQSFFITRIAFECCKAHEFLLWSIGFTATWTIVNYSFGSGFLSCKFPFPESGLSCSLQHRLNGLEATIRCKFHQGRLWAVFNENLP